MNAFALGARAVNPNVTATPIWIDAWFDPQKEREAAQTLLVSGKFDVFEGPIKDNTGAERVKAGESMTDEQKLSFNWLVEGVQGQIPQ